MSFKVIFHQIVKPVNSTAVPLLPGEEYDCVTNGALDIINPVLDFTLPITSDVFRFNFCQVPNLNRYYWITNWEYSDRKWRAHCHVDVLASHKSAIGALTPYVLRSAYAYNGNIMDSFYPAKAKWTKAQDTKSNPWALSGTGCFSVGIISARGDTRYYLFSKTGLANFVTFLFSDTYANAALTLLDINAYPEAKAILDPLQYIASITYLPYTIPTEQQLGVSVGYVNVSTRAVPIDKTIPYTSTYTFTRPVHPQSSTRGVFLNAAPYTRLSLYFPPFGVIDIDTSAALTESTISATVFVDKALGNATLEISAGAQILSRVNGRVGIPVQMSQVIAPGYGLLSGLSAVAGAATNALTGNWGGLASGVMSSIGDAVKSQIPSANTIGSVGSVDSMIGDIKLQALFAEIVDDDLTCRGRPLCEVRQISTIPGFIQCADVEVHLSCTSGEMDEIKSYMETGFFYA